MLGNTPFSSPGCLIEKIRGNRDFFFTMLNEWSTKKKKKNKLARKERIRFEWKTFYKITEGYGKSNSSNALR